MQAGRVDAAKSVQLGIRGNPRTLEWLNTSRDLGYQIITKADYDARGHVYGYTHMRHQLPGEVKHVHLRQLKNVRINSLSLEISGVQGGGVSWAPELAKLAAFFG